MFQKLLGKLSPGESRDGVRDQLDSTHPEHESLARATPRAPLLEAFRADPPPGICIRTMRNWMRPLKSISLEHHDPARSHGFG